MVVKDKVVSWFVQNILLSGQERIDVPGYITEEISEKGQKFKIRSINLPENLFVVLEKEIIKSNKQRGRLILYSIGKKFGYNYVRIMGLPTYGKKASFFSKEKFLTFVNFFVRYIESVYAKKLVHDVDLNKKIFRLKMDGYIICSYNGLGYILSEGGIAGIWAWGIQDKNVEATQPKCQGRGDKECEVIAAPYERLVKMGYKPTKAKELVEIELDKEYEGFNKIRSVKWAKNSLRKLIDSGFFKYSHGHVSYIDERLVLCEASFMYILESELKKLKNGLKILWGVSFDFGKKLAEKSGKQDPAKFIMDFFPALGFGDILIVTKKGKYEIVVNYFPWLELANKIDFVMFRGMLSGVISGFTGKKVELKKITKDLTSGYLSLSITQ